MNASLSGIYIKKIQLYEMIQNNVPKKNVERVAGMYIKNCTYQQSLTNWSIRLDQKTSKYT